MTDTRRFKTPAPGPLFPNGSYWLLAITVIGSIVFGWEHKALWLIVPPATFVIYAVVEQARSSAWAKREMDLTWRNVFDTWMSGLPFRGYGGFMVGNPVINFVVFGFAWAVSSSFDIP